MARINLDDSFFSDARVIHLSELSKESKFSVRGRLIGLWHYCTEKTRDRLSDLEINQQTEWFGKDGQCYAKLLVEAGLAIQIKSFFRIKGTRERYKWLQAKRKNSAKGGAVTAAKISEVKSRRKAEQGLSAPKAGAETGPTVGLDKTSEGPLVTDPILELTPAHDHLSSPTDTNVTSVVGKRTVPSKVLDVWTLYSIAFKRRYKSLPPANSKNYSHCKQLVDRIGLEDAREVVGFYLQHNDSFYVRACHSLSLLVRDAEKVRTEWATGSLITGTLSRREDLKQDNTQSLSKYLERTSNESA